MANPNPTPFKKTGADANPKGRPKAEWSWSGELKKAAEESAKDGKSMKHHISRSLMVQAIKGNVQAFNAIANRMDGMPSQDITSGGEKIVGPSVYTPIKKND